MKLKNMPLDELEQMNYGELAKRVLEEKGSKEKIVDVFKTICDLLELSESEFENHLGDFFEIVSTDKNFIVLEGGFIDLRSKHIANIVIQEDDEDEEEVSEEEINEDEDNTEPEENEEEDIFYDGSSDEDDVTDDDDDLGDFIIEDEEEASN